MKTGYDVVIIGAGVVGGSIARELSRYKLRIALIEKEADASFGTSKANSGIIHSGFHSRPGSLKLLLEARGNRAFDLLAEELGFPFERRGELIVAFDDREQAVLQSLHERAKSIRIPYVELLDRKRTLQIEPNLNPRIVGSLYAATTGIVGPYEYCFALVENAVRNGVELFLEEKVISIKTADDRNLRLETARGLRIKARYVVNAAGLYADEIASLAGLNDFKIHPVKGEEYLLDKRTASLARHVIFPIPTEKSKGILVIPTVDGPVMVGPTAEDVESKEDHSTSRTGMERVFEQAGKLIPSIDSRDVITAFAGLRPVADGDDFIIGKTRVRGFINAAGIQSPGLTASPAIAEMVRDVLLREGLALKRKPDFDPVRKPAPRIREAVERRDFESVREMISADPKYRKIVCRCENVTEAEVVDAIRHGHVTLDGIKFASRARSGRCQGGFCTCRIMSILHRETGMPIEAITKKGAGSEIVACRLLKGESHGPER